MTVEDRLRDALQTEANDVDSDATWEDVQRDLVSRRRNRRVRHATLTALAAAAVVAGVLAMVVPDDDRSSLRVISPTPEPTVTTAMPATTLTTKGVVAPPQDGPPEVAIASTEDGAVVLLTIDTGEVRRVLAPSPEPGLQGAGNGVSMTDDGSVAFFSNGKPTPPAELDLPIFRVDLPNGTPELIAHGLLPAISPDGRRLAYVQEGPDSTFGETRLVVRELRTGQERHWDLAHGSMPDSAGQAVFASVAWSPDSSELVYSEGFEDITAVKILDVEHDTTLDDATEVPMPSTLGYSRPLFRDRDHLIVVAGNPYGPEVKPDRTVLIDRAGRELETFVDEPSAPLAVDRTGRFMLYDALRVLDDPQSGSRQVATLSQWSGPGTTAAIAEGYVAADW